MLQAWLEARLLMELTCKLRALLPRLTKLRLVRLLSLLLLLPLGRLLSLSGSSMFGLHSRAQRPLLVEIWGGGGYKGGGVDFAEFFPGVALH